MITIKDLEICFRIRFRIGKANKLPQIFFRICFRNGHVGYTQATATGHAYEINYNPGDFVSRFRFRNYPKSWDFYLFSLVLVSVRMVV